MFLKIGANTHEKQHNADDHGPLMRGVAEQVRGDLTVRVFVGQSATSHDKHRKAQYEGLGGSDVHPGGMGHVWLCDVAHVLALC